MRRYYHYIIGRECNERFGDTSTRKEYIGGKAPILPDGWVVIGVCGFHDKEDKKG